MERVTLFCTKEKSELRVFLIAIFSVTTFFIIAISNFSIRFDTNDDAFLSLVSKGIVVNHSPSEFLLFIHVFIGIILKNLYSLYPTIPWYGIFLYSLLYFSLIFIGFAVLRLQVPFFLWVVWFSAFGLAGIITIQFTIVALFLVGGAVMILASMLLKPPKKNLAITLYIAVVILILLSCLIRFQAMLLGLSFVAPLGFLALIYKVKYNKVQIIAAISILTGVLLCSYALKQVDKKYYQNSLGWESFHAYNEARADFIDRSRVIFSPDTKQFFDNVGWTQNDLNMLLAWFYIDKTRYSKSNLDYLRDHASYNLENMAIKNLSDLTIFTFINEPYNIIFLFIIFIFTIPTKCRKDKITCVGLFTWAIGIYIILTIVERQPPFRVWMPFLGITATIPLLLFRLRKEKPHLTLRGKFHPIIVWGLVLIFMNVTIIADVSKETLKQRTVLENDIVELAPQPKQLFVIWGESFPYENIIHPFFDLRQLMNFNILALAVGSHEPVVQERLKEFHIKDLYEALYVRKDIFLIATEGRLDLLHTYLQEHYNIKTSHIVYFEGHGFKVYRIVKN